MNANNPQINREADLCLSSCCGFLELLKSREPKKTTRRARKIDDITTSIMKLLVEEYQSSLSSPEALDIAKHVIIATESNLRIELEGNYNEGSEM